jgi:SAM-dependent methyltransferase
MGARFVAAWAIHRAQELIDPLTARRELGADRARTVPGRRLRARTGAPGARAFAEGGRLAAAELRDALGSDVGAVRSLLDFGCGSGRVLPHMAALAPSARAAGCDIDRDAIDWAGRNLPEFRWRVSAFRPPLPFERDSFDLVYSISVFSHLDEPMQDRWLQELQRVLRPGGVALLSVHGAFALDQFRTGTTRTGWCRPGAFDRPPLTPGEFAFEPYVKSPWNRGELPGVDGEYGLAFHGVEYLQEHWSRFLDVSEVRDRALSAWQDLVVCRKVPG